MIKVSLQKLFTFAPAVLVAVAILVIFNAFGNSLPIVRELYGAAWLFAAAAAIHYTQIFLEGRT